VKVRPVGRAPVSVTVGAGLPVVVTVKGVTGRGRATPTVAVVVGRLVKVGAVGGRTVRVKLWVADGATPLLEVMVNVYEGALPAGGVPASVAVPSWLSVRIAPEGRAPDSEIAATG
jgi:hypothetical protein